jgi:hypothetical protein
MFTSTREVKLEGFIDADWACDTNTRRSTARHTLQIDGLIITWSRK